MLWSCQESQSLIDQFFRWLNSKNIILTLVEELFIFNIGNTYLLSDLQIIMFIKYYIYITKYLNQQLSLIALKNKLKFFYELEKYAATKNNHLVKFEQKWYKYKELLEAIH